MAKVWLVTGSASGLGRAIAQAALDGGDQVVASARKPEELDDLASKYKGAALAVKHDVTIEGDAKAAVRKAMDVFGRLDVVVNNAGYGQFGPFEQMSSQDFKNIVDTCFYGVVYTTRAALPVMRNQRDGVIFQISSLGGRITRPGNSPYHAAKWAVSGFSEALAQETAKFGVRICSLEPGGIRTNWGKRAAAAMPDLLPDYQESVGAVLQTLDKYWGHENSDPKRIADLIVTLSRERTLPSHLLLGSDAVNLCEKADEERATLAKKWHDTSVSVDYGAGNLPDKNF